MAEQPPSFQFEDVPLEQARRMGRGPRMDSELYQELRRKVQSLSDTAVRMSITDGTRLETVRNWVRSVATELGIPVTIRSIPGGLVFWRSTDEDLEVAREVGARLQTAQQRPRRGRRPGQRRRGQ